MEKQISSSEFHAKKKPIKKIVIMILLFILLLALVGLFLGNRFYHKIIKSGDKNELYAEINQAVNSYSDNDKAFKEALKTRENVSSDFEKNNPPESVYMTSTDGLKLHALKFKAQANAAKPIWIVSVHGFNADSSDMKYFASYFNEMGYNVLLPDLRGHGKSEGEYLGMGYRDREDVLMWVNFLVLDNAESKIVLHGVSMGGAAVISAAGDKLISDRVVGIISDSSYTTLKDELSYLDKNKLSVGSFPTLNFADVIIRMRAGYSLNDAAPINKLSSNKLPILFIHGGADEFIPPSMTDELYGAADGVQKDKLIIEGGYHGHSATAAPNIYFKKISDFIKPILSE